MEPNQDLLDILESSRREIARDMGMDDKTKRTARRIIKSAVAHASQSMYEQSRYTMKVQLSALYGRFGQTK